MSLTPETVARLLAQGMPAEKLAGYLNPDGTVRGLAGTPPAAEPAGAAGPLRPAGPAAARILAIAGEHPGWHVQQIAAAARVTPVYVSRVLSAHRVTVARKTARCPKTAFADEDTVAAVYASLQSINRTAYRLGVSYGTVRNRLISAGVQRRPGGRPDQRFDPVPVRGLAPAQP